MPHNSRQLKEQEWSTSYAHTKRITRILKHVPNKYTWKEIKPLFPQLATSVLAVCPFSACKAPEPLNGADYSTTVSNAIQKTFLIKAAPKIHTYLCKKRTCFENKYDHGLYVCVLTYIHTQDHRCPNYLSTY